MKTVGIIAEYNPFHNGHLWHLREAKRRSGCNYSVAVMSGNFVQRGEPALFDKWARAEMAVRAGIDLVIELPVVFAVRSAQFFARGAIRLLNALGIVNYVCFGTESPDPLLLTSAAGAIDNPQVTTLLKAGLNSGKTYAAALADALAADSGIAPAVLAAPNNILAIEYLRALKKYAPSLTPVLVKRQQADHHSPIIYDHIASAVAIRQALLANLQLTNELRSTMPVSSQNIITSLLAAKCAPVTLDSLSSLILARLRTSSAPELFQVPEVSEGLQFKLYDSAIRAISATDLLAKVKSKRYLRTRLQRILLWTLLGIKKDQLLLFDKSGPLYVRILGCNQNGRKLLNSIKNNSQIPLVTKTSQFINGRQKRNQLSLTPLQQMLAIDITATDIFVLGIPSPRQIAGGRDFLRSPVVI